MKVVTIEPVEPAPSRPNSMSESGWKRATNAQKAAWKKQVDDVANAGAIECNYVTAIESVRLSRGLYRIRPEAAPTPDVPQFSREGIAVMGRAGLVGMAATLGVTITKPTVATEDLRRVILEKFDVFMDGEEDDD